MCYRATKAPYSRERSRGLSIDLASGYNTCRNAIEGFWVMGTDKDAADKAKAAVERVEAEEDEARAKSGQRSGKRTQADRPRGVSINQRIK